MGLPDEIGCVIVAWKPDPAAVGQLELVQVGQVPAGELGVDRLRQLLKRVAWTDDEDPARTRVALDTAPAEQLDLDPQPSTRHHARRLQPVMRQLLRLKASLSMFCSSVADGTQERLSNEPKPFIKMNEERSHDP